MNLIFSDITGALHGLGDQRNGSITGARNAVICGRGLKNELYILQHEEASTNVIHGTSAAAAATGTAMAAAHSPEENKKEASATDADVKDSACLQASPSEAKIQLLQAESHRIEAVASESLATKRELQMARLKIKHLKRRLRGNRARARKKMESLDRKIAEAANESEVIGAEVRRKRKELEDLQDTADVLGKANLMMRQENMELEQRNESAKTVLSVLEDPQVIRSKMKELEDLEDAAEELGRTNLMMKQENKELEQRMESAKMLLSVLEHPQSEEALEEINRLRESNAKLQKKIGRLEAKQKADAEELSQLRWLNNQLSEEFFCKSPSPATPKAGNKDRQKRASAMHDDFNHKQHQHQQQKPELSDPERATAGHASPEGCNDHWRKLKILRKFKSMVSRKNSKSSDDFEPAALNHCGWVSSSTCSDDRLSAASSCATAEEQSAMSPAARSGADADERWSSKSAWINGAFHGRYY